MSLACKHFTSLSLGSDATHLPPRYGLRRCIHRLTSLAIYRVSMYRWKMRRQRGVGVGEAMVEGRSGGRLLLGSLLRLLRGELVFRPTNFGFPCWDCCFLTSFYSPPFPN